MAIVPGTGLASEFFDEVNSIKDNPQVHMHFLTGDKDYEEMGFGRVELCCHGCGESLMVLFSESARGAAKLHMEVRDSFVKKHHLCENRGYEKLCPNYRSKFEEVDVRKMVRKTARPRRRRAGIKKESNASLRSSEVRREGPSAPDDRRAPEHGAPNHPRLDPRGDPVR